MFGRLGLELGFVDTVVRQSMNAESETEFGKVIYGTAWKCHSHTTVCKK